MFWLFGKNEFAQDIFDTKRTIKEIREGKQTTVGQQSIFMCGRSADRSLVQSQASGHFRTSQRMQVADALLKKLLLIIHYQLRDSFQRIPSSLHTVNEKFGA